MTFTATSRPRRLSFARYTVAIPPWPISSITSYFAKAGRLRVEEATNRPNVPPRGASALAV